MKIAIIGSFPHAAKEQIINRFPEAWEVRFCILMKQQKKN